MGFLEDLGRSNALGSVDNLLGRAIEIRRNEDVSADRAMGRAIDFEQLNIAKEASNREATKFEWQKKEQKQKEDIDNIPVPLTALFGTGWEKDPAKKLQFDKMKEMGLVEEVAPGIVMTTNKNAQALKDYGTRDLEWTKQVNEANMITVNNQITKVGAAIAGDKDAIKELGLKPEELAEKKKELEKQLSNYVASHKRINFAQQDKIELEKERQKTIKNAKVAADPHSETGWSWYDTDGNVVLRGAPKPTSAVAEKRVEAYDRHNRAWEAIKKSGGVGGSGGGSTALIKNAKYLASLGWSETEATKLLTSSKPMSKDTFIAQTTMRAAVNEMIPPEDKMEAVQRAVEIYDKFIAKGLGSAPQSKTLDNETAAKIFKEAGNDPKKATKIARERGYDVPDSK